MVEYLQILTLNARKEMALHLVLICPALLAAQDSNGRFVSNSDRSSDLQNKVCLETRDGFFAGLLSIWLLLSD